ncbi:MAG: ABC transporter substrate-binding protein [Nitrospira sp.]|nr:ABC transporter substrate-binding protein [Nitrospira sp.]MDH4244899.1 ABC transporter substrate-binding protein [Nitrospira sp.]MDH4357364.1 ABC transporter substrate-binding protein [Nitrospira sp.]MDH5319621.1 ABC transporter substrate-binding protein [Nitrospira sp.]
MLLRLSLLVLLSLTTLWSTVEAEEIVIVKSGDLPSYDQAVVGFRAGIPSLVKVKEYNLNGHLTRGREIGRALRASPPDLIFAVGLKAAMSTKLEIFDTPVVFCMVLNPETYDLPASNMTGIAVRAPSEAQLAAIRSLMPNRKRIGVLYGEDQSGAAVHEAIRVAGQQGLELVPVAVRSQEDVAHALSGLLPKIDVLWLIQDQLVVSESAIPVFLESSLKTKVPIFTFSSTLVQQGAVGALVLDPWAVGQQAARLSLRRLTDAGASAGTMEAPEHSQWALNLKSAAYFDITLDPELIRMANQLFSGSGLIAHYRDSSDLTP